MEMLFYVQHPEWWQTWVSEHLDTESVITFMSNRYSQVKLLKALWAPQCFPVPSFIPLFYSHKPRRLKKTAFISILKSKLMSCISFDWSCHCFQMLYTLSLFSSKQSLKHRYDSVSQCRTCVCIIEHLFNAFKIQVWIRAPVLGIFFGKKSFRENLFLTSILTLFPLFI